MLIQFRQDYALEGHLKVNVGFTVLH